MGKTWILKEFGKNEFAKTHYINFEADKKYAEIFAGSLSPKQILNDLSITLNDTIDPKTDLIIFDEIQACPRALTSLKYFCEDLPEQAVCCAGSLLGVVMSPESFPVGKVDFLNLYPLSFEEFLWATEPERGKALFDEIRQTLSISNAVADLLMRRLREYCFTGGMPQAVVAYCSQADANPITIRHLVRQTQQALLKSYDSDIAKHSGKMNSMHIISVFENIPMQLARQIDGSVERYKFLNVIPGRKGYPCLAGPIEWLVQTGLIHKVMICNRIETPLTAFCKPNIFKLYYFDTGLLACALNLPPESILNQSFGMTKGFLIENLVCQEMTANSDVPLFSWAAQNSEIEFIMQVKDKIVPVEVKAGIRTRAKSLNVYMQKHKPPLAVIISSKPSRLDPQRVIQYLPLYLSGYFVEICARLLGAG